MFGQKTYPQFLLFLLVFSFTLNAQSNPDRLTPAETLGNPFVRPDIYKIEGKDDSYVLPSNISDWLNANKSQRENELESKLQIAKQWRQSATNYDPSYENFKFVEAKELQKYFFGISNIEGYIEYADSLGIFPVTKEHNAQINEPLYQFLYGNQNTGKTDIVVGAFTNKNGDPLNIQDYTFYDPISYEEVATNSLMERIGSGGLSMSLIAYIENSNGQKGFGSFSDIVNFKIENGQQNGILNMKPYLLPENPVSKYVNVTANDSSVVYHNGETDINNPASEEEILGEVNMNVETNVDTTATFSWTDGTNEMVGKKRIQKGKKLEKLVQVGSDPRNYDALVVSEAKGKYFGDMVNFVFPDGLPEKYVHDFFNPKLSKTLDSTWVKFRYEVPTDSLTFEDLEDIIVNYKENINTTPENLEAMGYNAIPEATSTNPTYPIEYEYKQSEPEPLSEEHPEIEYKILTTYYATQELPNQTLNDSTKYTVKVEDLEAPFVEARQDTTVSGNTELTTENLGEFYSSDNSGLPVNMSYTYELVSKDSTKEVYNRIGKGMDWKGNFSLQNSVDTQRVTKDLLTSIKDAEDELSKDFKVSQNYPNPFNPTTTIKFTIPQDIKHEMSKTILRVYDTLGKEVKTLANEQLAPGAYEIKFNGSDLASGIYFYTLTSGSHTQIRKMLLLK